MDVETLRDYCLSLGTDVEERMPFTAFRAAQGVLAFYVCGHMFCYFDIDNFQVISVKCQPQHIDELRAANDAVGLPYNMSPRHWIGIRPSLASDQLIRQLVADSYALVRDKYCK